MTPRLALVVPLAGAALLVLERRWPLRSHPRAIARLLTNATLGLLAGATTLLAEVPVVELTARHLERRRWGLARVPNRRVRTLLGVLWLDYTLYLWHRAAHVHPWLWRLHLPHHLDPILDSSSAWRFHVLELCASVPSRLLQVASAGVPREAIALWRQLLAISISFHHSNLRLPPALDRYLGAVIMTPRLHRIHHSARASQRDSNWSSGLTLWDHLHGTYRRDRDVAEIPIGVEGTPPAVRLASALLAPFAAERGRLHTQRKETIDEARTTQTVEPRAQDR